MTARNHGAARAFPLRLRRFSTEGGNLHADPFGVGIDVGFDGFDAQRLDAAVCRPSVETCMSQRFLHVVSPLLGTTDYFILVVIIVPRMARIVARRRLEFLPPAIHRDEQALRLADLEVVEADV